jgi:transcriptional pleiotropic regulator of transition state genes
MKGTGIIRRVDDLGRIIIPKEIRRALGISEGDPLEIYHDAAAGSVTFKRYHLSGAIADSIKAMIHRIANDDYLDNKSELLVKLGEIEEILSPPSAPSNE